jgi:hypothetical protein
MQIGRIADDGISEWAERTLKAKVNPAVKALLVGVAAVSWQQ